MLCIDVYHGDNDICMWHNHTVKTFSSSQFNDNTVTIMWHNAGNGIPFST